MYPDCLITLVYAIYRIIEVVLAQEPELVFGKVDAVAVFESLGGILINSLAIDKGAVGTA